MSISSSVMREPFTYSALVLTIEPTTSRSMLILKPWNIVLIMFMIIGLVRSGMSPAAGVARGLAAPAPACR